MSKRSVAAAAKDTEHWVAELMGAVRLVAGQHTGPGDVDLDGGYFKVQVKHRANIPAVITEGWKQIAEAATGEGWTPLLVLVTKPGQGRKKEAFVVMSLETWAKDQGP